MVSQKETKVKGLGNIKIKHKWRPELKFTEQTKLVSHASSFKLAYFARQARIT